MTFWLFFLTSFLFGFANQSFTEPDTKCALEAPNPHTSSTEIATITLKDLSNLYDVFFLDAYGVFWGSSNVGVLPGAAEAMEYLVSQGKHVGIISNSTQLASREKAKFQKYGLYEGVHYHFILTSGEVAKTLLTQESLPFPTPHYTYWVFGLPHPHFGSHGPLFAGTRYRETKNLQEADFIYISIPHVDGVDQENPEIFRHSVQEVESRLPVFCVNPDRFAPEGSPPHLVVRQGTIASMFAERQFPVYFMGKPSRIIFEMALRQLPSNTLKERIVMIGDTPETDLRGAHTMAIDAVLVTKTGVMTSLLEKEGTSILHQLPPEEQPKFILEHFRLD